MRVMVGADIEGVAGVTSWEHTGGRTPLYEEGRRLYTEEINAIVRACRRAKVDEIIVVDGHGGGYEGARAFMSLIPDRLEQGARYVLGHAWARYVEPLTQGCDAVLFVGAHAKAGTPGGVLSHTVSSEAWYLATINGTPVGESGAVAEATHIFASGHLPGGAGHSRSTRVIRRPHRRRAGRAAHGQGDREDLLGGLGRPLVPVLKESPPGA